MSAFRAEPVIRAAQSAGERRAVLALLDEEWPGEGPWFRHELTDPRFRPEQFLVAMHGSSVVGHVQVAGPRRMQYGRAWLTVGGLHGLIVAPAWRGRGIGRRLVAAAHTLLAELGATVSLVTAPNPAFYEQFGYGRTFPLYSTVIAAEAAARAAVPLAVRPFRDNDLAAVAAAYNELRTPSGIGPFSRSDADWRWLIDLLASTDRSRLRPFFGRDRQLLVPVGPDSGAGYAWIGSANSRLWVFEAATPPEQADNWLAWLGARALIHGQHELAITAAPDHALAAAAYRHGGANMRKLGPGLACIIDFPRLLAETAPELHARFDPGAASRPCEQPLTATVLPAGFVASATATLPVPASGVGEFALGPADWVRLLFGQSERADAGYPPTPPFVRLLMPPATPHIWPADNRF